MSKESHDTPGEKISAESSQVEDQYRSKKPKWWTQLAGRRGTKAQRQAIQRMAEHGYVMPKQILTDFSRLSNRSKVSSDLMAKEMDWLNDQWKREWWNKALGVHGLVHQQSMDYNIHEIAFTKNDENDKYAHKFQEMVTYKNTLPAREYEEKWLEIGFGNGANIDANAQNHPNRLFIGSEIHQPGVGNLVQKMEERIRKDDCVDNIRILPGDGIKLLFHLPDKYLDCILITFPDPWPKVFHARWRVIQVDTIREMQRVLTANGRVFIATDAECFHTWTDEIFSKESINWKPVIPCPSREEWLPVISYYEQKGINEGRHTMLQCWQVASY